MTSKKDIEIEKLKTDFAAEDRRSTELLQQEIKQAEEETAKEIENESAYYRNCFDIASAKLRQETEAEVERVSKERYKDLGAMEASASQNAEAGAAELAKLNKAERDRALEKEREAFEQECRERRARFEQAMTQLMQGGYKDGKSKEYLKKEVVAIVHSTGMRVVADEAVFDRYNVKITRNALATGESFALYKAKCSNQSAVCLITVLSKVPIEVRKEYLSSTKCTRFLCENPRHPGFFKVYEIFSTSQKMYVFMEECDVRTLHMRVHSKKASPGDIDKWCRQLAQAYAYMHSYAIAHLNIRTENVIFDAHNNAKVAGLSRSFLYFSLDQEVIIKVPKVEDELYNSHYPPECFEGPFHSQPADVYSFGAMMFEMVTLTNPLKPPPQPKPAKGEKKKKKKAGIKKATHRFNPNLFDFSKVPNETQRALLVRMLSLGIMARPKFDELLKNAYIGADGADGRGEAYPTGVGQNSGSRKSTKAT